MVKLSAALLATAFLTFFHGAAGASESCACDCPKPMRHAPAHHAFKRADAESGLAYAQSAYDYRSASRVGEVVQVIRPGGYAVARSRWRVVPDDVNIHFYGDQGAAYGGDQMGYAGYGGGYAQGGYGDGGPDYGPPPPPEGLAMDNSFFEGGVGYTPGGGGGGYGGQAFLYGGQSGGQDEPSNGGGVNLPDGYGLDYHGNWHGYQPPGMQSKSGN